MYLSYRKNSYNLVVKKRTQSKNGGKILINIVSKDDIQMGK